MRSARSPCRPAAPSRSCISTRHPPLPVPQVDPRDAADAEAAVDLTICGACDCQFVQPVDWEEAGPRHWKLELRCPNCEARGTVVVEDAVVDHYDLVLERGSAELARSLHEVVAVVHRGRGRSVCTTRSSRI